MSRGAYFQAKGVVPETRRAVAFYIKGLVYESRKRRAVNRVLGPIGEKLAAEWLKGKGYEVHRFAGVIWMFREMCIAKKSRRRVRNRKEHTLHLTQKF